MMDGDTLVKYEKNIEIKITPKVSMSVESIKNKSTEELVELYRKGYVLDIGFNFQKQTDIFVCTFDTIYKNYMSDACIMANVRPIFEELEKIKKGTIPCRKIMEDIINSKAFFIILNQNIENDRYTRDLVTWMSGIATAYLKDIWVLEPFLEFGRISVSIPSVTHYMVFSQNDIYYLKDIIESYGNPEIVRPTGMTLCGSKPFCQHCGAIYEIHLLPDMNKFRCPVCGKFSILE